MRTFRETCSAAKSEEKRMFSQANTCIMEEANKRGRNFLSFSTWIWFLGTQLQERSLTCDKVSWNNRDEDWKIVNLLLKGNFQHLRLAVLSTKATKNLLSSLKYNNNRSGPLSISKCEREFEAVMSLKHYATLLSFIIILKCLLKSILFRNFSFSKCSRLCEETLSVQLISRFKNWYRKVTVNQVDWYSRFGWITVCASINFNLLSLMIGFSLEFCGAGFNLISKAPCQLTQHFWPHNSLNCWMLHVASVSHPVECSCVLFGAVKPPLT